MAGNEENEEDGLDAGKEASAERRKDEDGKKVNEPPRRNRQSGRRGYSMPSEGARRNGRRREKTRGGHAMRLGLRNAARVLRRIRNACDSRFEF